MSVQYEGREREGVGPAARADGAGPLEQDPTPRVEAGPGPVAGDDRQVGGEAGGRPLEVAVPAAADGAAVEPDGLVVERVERRRPAASGRRARRAAAASPVGGRWGRRKNPSRSAPAFDGQAELAVLEGERPQPVGRAAVGPVGRA